MARDFGPFPSKPMYEVVNRRMQRALAEAASSTGFTKTGQGAVTAGTGAQLVIAAYPDGALVDGLYVENPDPEPWTLTTNTASTNPRIDRLVLRLDMSAETIAPFQIVGTPAASPQIPPLVQTATVFDMPLCQYRFPGSASAQNPTNIIDERQASGEVSCRLTASNPGTPPAVRWGIGAPTVAASAGGTWTPIGDGIRFPASGLYSIWFRFQHNVVTGTPTTSYMEILDEVNTVLGRQPMILGDILDSMSALLPVTAGAALKFTAFMNFSGGTMTTNSQVNIARVGDL